MRVEVRHRVLAARRALDRALAGHEGELEAPSGHLVERVHQEGDVPRLLRLVAVEGGGGEGGRGQQPVSGRS